MCKSKYFIFHPTFLLIGYIYNKEPSRHLKTYSFSCIEKPGLDITLSLEENIGPFRILFQLRKDMLVGLRLTLYSKSHPNPRTICLATCSFCAVALSCKQQNTFRQRVYGQFFLVEWLVTSTNNSQLWFNSYLENQS